MAQSIGKRSPRKSKPTYITSILMISLVLVMLGLIGLIGLHFKELSTLVKENVQVSIFLKETTNELEIMQMQKKLEAEDYVKFVEYVSKEDAKRKFLEGNESETDFEDLLGFNPLPASLNVYLNAKYANADSIQMIKTRLQSRYDLEIQEMNVNEELVAALNKNLGFMSIVLIGISIILVIIALVLIDSTVRLSMYSNRFLIKSMQLVGADRWFIRRPYVTRSIINGFISGILAIIAITGILFLVQQEFPDIRQLQNLFLTGILFVVILLMGVLISWWSTYRSVTKYQKLKLDELY